MFFKKKAPFFGFWFPSLVFRNIFPVLRNPKVFRHLIDLLCEHVKEVAPGAEVLVGLESRGFLFGPMMAEQLGVAFVPVRKAGKLPGECCCVSYSLEYGTVSMCVCVCVCRCMHVFNIKYVCVWVYACGRMGAGEIRGGENVHERQR